MTSSTGGWREKNMEWPSAVLLKLSFVDERFILKLNPLGTGPIVWDVDQVLIQKILQLMKVLPTMVKIQTKTQNLVRTHL